MDADAKKTALRMIPYGLYVLTGESKDGKIAASTINWVTQTAFQPPLLVVGIKADSGAHAIIKESKNFALNILGKDQKSQAFTFFKPLEREGNTIGGESFRKGSLGAPILEKARAFVECELVETVERGDHSIFIGEVKDAGVAAQPVAGRTT
jgi:flavin reductase (DIM6/NTAB) family NADH-FMN oxidoreductase RutF